MGQNSVIQQVQDIIDGKHIVPKVRESFPFVNQESLIPKFAFERTKQFYLIKRLAHDLGQCLFTEIIFDMNFLYNTSLKSSKILQTILERIERFKYLLSIFLHYTHPWHMILSKKYVVSC